MPLRVALWGTGNVGRPAIRAILAHQQLELAAVIVSNPEKEGIDAGLLAGLGETGVLASCDSQAVLAQPLDAVVYTATADTRPEEAYADLAACLAAGVNVVSTSFYAFLHPASCPDEALQPIQQLCDASGASLLVSGIDPGWAMDSLPIAVSGAVANIQQIRCREIFNYALYDQPKVVREVIGLGGPMDELPMMLHDFAMEMVWGPMLRVVADAMGKPVDEIRTEVERRPLENDVTVPGMGLFEAGSLGAFRFEVQGFHQGKLRYVLEHVTRIDEACATDWPYPPQGGGCHQVIISGDPDLHVTVHAEDHHEPGAAGGGNASAANWIVNALPAVCAAAPGPLTILDIPRFNGAQQMAD